MSRPLTPLVLVAALLWAPPAHAASSARGLYTSALARERAIRTAAATATRPQFRSVMADYEQIVRRHPTSGYADNALWQAAQLALDAHARFGDERDRRDAGRLLEWLAASYPSSSLAATARQRLHRRAPAPVAVSATAPAPVPVPTAIDALPAPTSSATGITGVRLRGVNRVVLPEVVRITLELDGEVPYHVERLRNPSRLFFDLQGARAAPNLTDATLAYGDDVVRQIRLGRRPQDTTRVVIDLERVGRFSVFTLYNPYRLVIDCERAGVPLPPALPARTLVADVSALPTALQPSVRPATETPGAEAETLRAPAPARVEEKAPAVLARRSVPPVALTSAVPAPAAANANGTFSLARQLGLGVSRIVIDPGHGGHDPGTRASRVVEAELVLDVALRLEKLLLKQSGLDVLLTRRTDEFIPLEERTAIANREGADLFLSIHANASRKPSAGGVETYFLNFASDPEAAAVAARENSATSRTMHSLPDIVKAIALNNKLDESRDLAALVQQSMVKRLRPQNRQVRDRGVKQAPFVVLIGAQMPSVLAEISFITHRTEGPLLRGGAYRQRIAEALFDAVVRYQRALKSVGKMATTGGD